MKPQMKNIVRYAIAIAMLLQTIGFLVAGKDPNLASSIGICAIIITPKIPSPQWFDAIALTTAAAIIEHLEGII